LNIFRHHAGTIQTSTIGLVGMTLIPVYSRRGLIGLDVEVRALVKEVDVTTKVGYLFRQ
jgi:hypothetical protein